MTRKMSKTAAIREARRQHGAVGRYTPGPQGYGYCVWSERHQAYWQPTRTTGYAEAARTRAASIYETAATLMYGMDRYGIGPLFIDERSGVPARQQFDNFVAKQGA